MNKINQLIASFNLQPGPVQAAIIFLGSLVAAFVVALMLYNPVLFLATVVTSLAVAAVAIIFLNFKR
jgi:uncharacterized membrane protein YccC